MPNGAGYKRKSKNERNPFFLSHVRLFSRVCAIGYGPWEVPGEVRQQAPPKQKKREENREKVFVAFRHPSLVTLHFPRIFGNLLSCIRVRIISLRVSSSKMLTQKPKT
jgi:hypothetical protein